MLIRQSQFQIKMAAVLVLSLAATSVYAGHNKHRYSHRSHYEGNYVNARVVNAHPIVEIVQVPQNHQVCYDQTVRRRAAGHHSVIPTVMGAAIGGVIGHQFGGGHGKTAAMVAGAFIGGAVANRTRHYRNSARHPARYRSVGVQNCHVESRWLNEEQIVGWDVTWKYHGRKYHSTVAEQPGKRIRVRVSVNAAYR